jgi:hypothetical protein
MKNLAIGFFLVVLSLFFLNYLTPAVNQIVQKLMNRRGMTVLIYTTRQMMLTTSKCVLMRPKLSTMIARMNVIINQLKPIEIIWL